MRAAVLTEVNKPLQILDLVQEPPKANEVTRGRWRRGGERAGRDCGQAGRSCDLLVPAALWPLPLLLIRPHRPVRRPQRYAALGDARRHDAREA